MRIGTTQSNQNNSNTVMDGIRKKNSQVKETRSSTKPGTNHGRNISINAGELTIFKRPDTELKRLLAQKAAVKKQLDQFKRDAKIDQEIDKHAAKRDAYAEEAAGSYDQMSKTGAAKDDLKKAYGITEDCPEEKDLKLIKKLYQGEALSKEELDHLAGMGPLTEYQKQSLEYDAMIDIWEKNIVKANEKAHGETRMIDGIKLDRLKTHEMVDAKEAAAEILKAMEEDIQKAIAQEIKKRAMENLNLKEDDQLPADPQDLIHKKLVNEEDIKGLAVDERV